MTYCVGIVALLALAWVITAAVPALAGGAVVTGPRHYPLADADLAWYREQMRLAGRTVKDHNTCLCGPGMHRCRCLPCPCASCAVARP